MEHNEKDVGQDWE